MDKSLQLCIALFFFVNFACAQNCKREPRCKITRVHGMRTADCFHKELRSFPQCIASDVEIIDASYNRIRKLTKNDLKRYSDLKYLYLSDNLIVTIDDETFEGMDELILLSLSMNAITKIPPVVFQLPSLRSLHLSQNLNINIVDAIEKVKPINSPLSLIDISYLTDPSEYESNQLPLFGELPYLRLLNITGNDYTDLTPTHFAGLCSLKELVSVNSTSEFLEECNCWKINWWLTQRKVKFTPFACRIDQNKCTKDIDPEDIAAYNKCKENVKTMEVRSRLWKILIPVCIGLVLIAAIGIYMYMNSRKRRSIQKNRELADSSKIPLNSTK